MTVRVVADTGTCIGAGMCVATAPAVFDQDPETGLVVVLTAEVAAEGETAARDAVEACPSGALSLTE